MKLLIADKLETHAIEELKHLGVEVVYDPELTRDSLPKALVGVGILVVRSTQVTAAAIDAGKQLHLVVRAGAGTNTIDVQAASARGIYVANCPGKNAVAVAELTMGLLCALDRRIPDATERIRAGRWEKGEFSKADGLYGKTLGLAGFGAIAKEVAQRARGFGMTVLAYSRSLTPQRAAEHGVAFARSLEELASRCHALSVHLPLTDRTQAILSKSILDALPDGAMVINTARAELVDWPALQEAMARKKLRVGTDVLPEEPAGASAELVSAFVAAARENKSILYVTPHVGASTTQAQNAIAGETVRIVRSFLVSGEVPNVVNVCARSPARYQMVVRSLDKVGVLANVLSVIKRHGLNVEELSSTIFDGAIAACTKLRVTGRPSEACISEIKAFDEVMGIDVVALPNLA